LFYNGPFSQTVLMRFHSNLKSSKVFNIFIVFYYPIITLYLHLHLYTHFYYKTKINTAALLFLIQRLRDW